MRVLMIGRPVIGLSRTVAFVVLLIVFGDVRRSNS